MSRIESYNDTEITGDIVYHLEELINQDLVNANHIISDGRIKLFQGLSLTWDGHDLLASISNRFVWESIKEKLNEHDLTVNDVPIEVIKKISEKIIIDMLGV
ncbi:MAG TPA: DUF2513 domain-containing protein, partial [Bacillota bacterium]|nr:DUF2513 domain-containing protein [Bacillota bacterium]